MHLFIRIGIAARLERSSKAECNFQLQSERRERTARQSRAAHMQIAGRASDHSLYAQDLVTFEDDRGAYDQKDAQGFIKLNALRLRTLASRKRKAKS